MTVAELNVRMTTKEMASWYAYSLVEPFGDFTRHHMLAQQTALIFNVNRDAKQKPLDADDFNHFLSKHDKKPPQSISSASGGWLGFEAMLSAKADEK